jgi:hypothetical protein
MLPAHFAEVATRNAVSDVLTAVYGPNWPWQQIFRQSLPSPSSGFSPRQDLIRTAAQEPTTGKVIAELKFVFWETMFTARHDERLWTPYIHQVFPNGATHTPNVLRKRIREDLEAIRRVRNRIAHHEPIIGVGLATTLTRMVELVNLRCSSTANWVKAMEEASTVIAQKP